MIDGAKMQSTFDAVAATFGDANGTLNAVELSAALMAGGSSNGRLNRDQFYADASALGLGEAEQQAAFASFGGDNANAASTVDVNDIVGRAQQYNGGQGTWDFEQFERFVSGANPNASAAPAPASTPAPAVSDTPTPAVAPTSPAQSKFEATALSPQVFNADKYADYNPDLPQNPALADPKVSVPPEAVEAWKAGLQQHWLNHGISEGRRASEDFDTGWCMQEYNLQSPQAVISAYGDLSAEQVASVKTSSLTKDGSYQSRLVNSDGSYKYNADGSYQTATLKMDTYTPPGASKASPGSIPVVIDLVGGGGASCEYNALYMRAGGTKLADQGFAVLAPQYHVTHAGSLGLASDTAPFGTYPQSQYDLHDVLMYVKENAAANNWDLNNITLMGFSAGAGMTLLQALNPKFASSELPPIKNFVATSPATDATIDVLTNETLPGEPFKSDDLAAAWVDAAYPDTKPGMKVEGNARWDASALKYVLQPDLFKPAAFADKNFLLSYAANDEICMPAQQFDPFIKAWGENRNLPALDLDQHKGGGHVLMGHFPSQINTMLNYYEGVGNWIKSKG